MKPRSDGATLNGFLDKGSHFKGELSFEETFRIDGKFEGTIPMGSELILGDSAEVDAEIRVERVSINGTLKGTVHASERIEIHPKRARHGGPPRAGSAHRRRSVFPGLLRHGAVIGAEARRDAGLGFSEITTA